MLKKVAEIENGEFNENESLDLEDQGLKAIIPCNKIDIYTRLEILPGVNISGHTITLTEASTLVDELYKRGEIQNEDQYRNALDKFSTRLMELPSKLLEQMAFNTRAKKGA